MISLYIIVVLSCIGLAKYIIVPLARAKTAAPDPTTTAAAAGPQYPHRDPFLGLDLTLQTWRDFQRGELCEGLRRRHAQLGPTFTTTPLCASLCASLGGGSGAGAGTTVYTTEPANIRAVTTRAFACFGKAPWAAAAARYVGRGVLVNDGAAWRRSRALLKPLFSRAAAALDEPALLEPHVRSLVGEMRRRGARGAGSGRDGGGNGDGDGVVFDFHELASMFTLDVVTEFLFGTSTDCLGNPERADGKDGVEFLALVKGFEGPSGQFIAVGPLAWLGLVPSYGRLMGLVDGMKAFFQKKLQDIVADPSLHRCAPRRLPEGCDVPRSIFRGMKEAGVSDHRIQGELQNIFFASYDTTSTFLANLMYVLVRHPDVQQRVREEIASLQGRPPTAKEMTRMNWLGMVIMEALRLYSPVSSHARMATVDTILPRGGGLDGQSPLMVRAGATVIWSTYALNRDPRWYGDDWAEFRPLRWEATWTRPKATTTLAAGASTQSAPKGEGDRLRGSAAEVTEIGENWRDFFTPFGSGPRACLGQTMVQTEVAYVIVRLLQEFPLLAMSAADMGVPFKEAKAVSFYNEGGVPIRVE